MTRRIGRTRRKPGALWRVWLLADQNSLARGYLVTQGDRVAEPIALVKDLSREGLATAFAISDDPARPFAGGRRWERELKRGSVVKLGQGRASMERIKGLVMWPVDRAGRIIRTDSTFMAAMFTNDSGRKDRPLSFIIVCQGGLGAFFNGVPINVPASPAWKPIQRERPGSPLEELILLALERPTKQAPLRRLSLGAVRRSVKLLLDSMATVEKTNRLMEALDAMEGGGLVKRIATDDRPIGLAFRLTGRGLRAARDVRRRGMPAEQKSGGSSNPSRSQSSKKQDAKSRAESTAK